ncbi:MAG: Type II secretion system protein E (GspE) [Parcubacteria group bacterium GW2011_GWE2_38_18]|nr:MAG: Type II secretion system protein E (GspE) [Parcubacteria group bacterium GW2011_GWE2_38_18]
MPNKIQSIEDLISSSQGVVSDDETAQSKLAAKEEEISVKEKERLTQQIAGQQGLPYINLFGFPLSPDAMFLIPEEVCVNLSLICFYYDGENIRIGTTYPSAEVDALLDQLVKEHFVKGEIYLVSERSLNYSLKIYKKLPKTPPMIKGVKIEAEDLEKFKAEIQDFHSLNGKINEVSISDVVTLIIAAALKTGSSDIHIEAEEHGVVVRLRVDGVLQEAAVIKKESWPRIISRMKLLAKVKINVTGKPQDGRYTIFLPDENIAVRSSFLPTSYGESVVMRLLKSSSVGLSFNDLGIMPRAFGILASEIEKPNGLILTTGPTGSGKTTTLYAILNKLNKQDVKIITLEDPIEYQLKGINQSQVDSSKGYTFANGLRSILRQDPDIVMVGEIRDLETAEISVQASLTGHLVLSTLHTNDASGVIPRLLDMGVKPYFLTPSINCIIGQRLVRKLCENCKQEYVMNEEDEVKINKILAVISPKADIDIPAILPKIYQAGPGCEKCNEGYKGRVGIYEIFTMDNDIKELTANEAPAFKILEKAIENGMITMLQDGVLKCLAGQTSLDEVFRVIGKLDYVDALYDIVVSKTIGRGIKIADQELAKAEELAKDLTKMGEAVENIPIKEMLNLVMAVAIKAEAGDVHIDPTENGVKIRYRIDGILHDIVKLSKEHYIPLISNVKDLSGFSISVKKATYDGRFSIFLSKEKMDCRVSIISGGYGETAVIRLLASQAASLLMENLGIRANALDIINKSIRKTKGIVITTGPTGSGKTTTLYSLLNKLNSPDVKIITIEDPIEYHMEGIMQTQINVDDGYTFAAALRSLMRQNPNVIMVGEIRDNETAKAAIEAAMTGHLVLSTIHSNSAAGAIARFVGLGIERQMLASSMECSVGQRLVRKICPYCKHEDQLPEDVLKEVKKLLAQINPSSGAVIPEVLKFYKGSGCEKCGNLGYKGRIGLYEAIEVSADIQKVIQGDTVTNDDIEQAAVRNGTLLMIHDGILKALDGETTIEEIFRVAR